MEKNKFRKVMAIIFMCLFVVAESQNVKAGTVLNPTQVRSYLDEISEYQMSANSNPGYGSTGGEWTVMSLARYGSINSTYIETYKSNLKAALDDCDGVLSKRKYTEYSRVVLALTAIGENPENFEGYNVLSPLFDYEKVAAQGANGMVYTLLALDSGNYEVTKKYSDGKTVRDKILESIIRTQLSDGGWSTAGTSAEVDVTAMVIQALVPYMEDEEIKSVVEKGFGALSGLQNENGGFSTMEVENCEAAAQVLTAMSEAGISVDDSRFVKNGKTILDALLEYYKDGAFSHIKGGGKNAIATDQAMYALVSYERKISDKNTLYNMSDGLVLLHEEQTTEIATKVETEKETGKQNQTDFQGDLVSNKNNKKDETPKEKNKTDKNNTKQSPNKNEKSKTESDVAEKNIEKSSKTSGESESREGAEEKGTLDEKEASGKRETASNTEKESGVKKETEKSSENENTLEAKEDSVTTEFTETRESSNLEQENKKESKEVSMNSGNKSYIIVMGAVIFLGASGLFVYNRSKITEWLGKRHEK